MKNHEKETIEIELQFEGSAIACPKQLLIIGLIIEYVCRAEFEF